MNYTFLKHTNALALLINKECNILFTQIAELNVDDLEIEPYFKEYFKRCHFIRPYFTLETSAKLLYDAIILTNKPHTDIVIMDYGAGIGTLYLLAKRIGVKQVIYNDFLPEFTHGAKIIDTALGTPMHEYITGDVLETCQALQQKNIEVDIVLSRNVLEHIYDLQNYFETIYKFQPKAILYNSTTANWNNPAAHIQHIYLHKKNKHAVVAEKANYILEHVTNITPAKAKVIAQKLISLGHNPFIHFIKEYNTNKNLNFPKKDYTNICMINGVWCEHLIPYSRYKKYAHNYNVQFAGGIWDVNYTSFLKRNLGKILNFITKILGKKSYISASFIYIIAIPKNK